MFRPRLFRASDSPLLDHFTASLIASFSTAASFGSRVVIVCTILQIFVLSAGCRFSNIFLFLI